MSLAKLEIQSCKFSRQKTELQMSEESIENLLRKSILLFFDPVSQLGLLDSVRLPWFSNNFSKMLII